MALLVLLVVLLELSVELQWEAAGSSGGDDPEETDASSASPAC